jgi:DNA-binding transcriptional ArsR family regulator
MLAELRNRPGVCTSELGELVGGQPNASRLLRRLEGLGLARSEELTRGAAGGRPYRLWWLTRTGGRLAGLDGKP